ncbi:MAG: exosortase C-terminal domain/associated protein EpsI [Sphingomonas sp.]
MPPGSIRPGSQAAPRRRLEAPVASLLVLTVASLFLGWSSLVASRAAPLPATVALPQVPGWTRTALSTRAPWSPNFPAADHFLIGRYSDARGRSVDLAVAVYASQHEGKELVGFGIGAIRENDRWVRIEDLPALDGGKALRMTGPGTCGARDGDMVPRRRGADRERPPREAGGR